MNQAIAPIMAVIDAYQAATGLKDSTISSRVFRDGRIVGHLRTGSTLTMNRFAASLQRFSDIWPSHAVWPAHVSRPPHREAA